MARTVFLEWALLCPSGMVLISGFISRISKRKIRQVGLVIQQHSPKEKRFSFFGNPKIKRGLQSFYLIPPSYAFCTNNLGRWIYRCRQFQCFPFVFPIDRRVPRTLIGFDSVGQFCLGLEAQTAEVQSCPIAFLTSMGGSSSSGIPRAFSSAFA